MLREEREVVIAIPVVFSADGSLSCTFFVSNTFSPDSVCLRENVLLNLFVLRNYSPFCFLRNISRPGACFKHAHFFLLLFLWTLVHCAVIAEPWRVDNLQRIGFILQHSGSWEVKVPEGIRTHSASQVALGILCAVEGGTLGAHMAEQLGE